METNHLPKTVEKKLRRLGQGHGSGRGKTSGRGTKGQKARGKIPTFFEGGALPLTKRMPFLRGRGRNKIVKSHPIALDIIKLSRLSGKVVDVDSLVKSGIVDKSASKVGVKLIGSTKITGKYEVKVPATAGARKAIEQAGGSLS